MKFLVDESLPPALCKWLVAKGHQADHVIRLRLNGRPDQEIWAKARRTSATIITKDTDYLTALPAFSSVPVVWLGFGNTLNRQLMAEVDRAWSDIEVALNRGQTPVLVLPPDLAT